MIEVTAFPDITTVATPPLPEPRTKSKGQNDTNELRFRRALDHRTDDTVLFHQTY